MSRGHIKANREMGLDSGYTEEEVSLMMAMDRYKRERRRPFPTWPEVLAVAKSLGYRLVAKPETTSVYERHPNQRHG